MATNKLTHELFLERVSKIYGDTIAARKAGEEKYFGEWSYDNSQRT